MNLNVEKLGDGRIKVAGDIYVKDDVLTANNKRLTEIMDDAHAFLVKLNKANGIKSETPEQLALLQQSHEMQINLYNAITTYSTL